jgi:hypothetical protein
MSTRKPKLPPPSGPFDVFCRRWLGIPAPHAMRIVGLGLFAGASMEAFMIKGWIGQTNFYETVKKKEAEKRLEAASKPLADDATPGFGEIVKQQWEEKKRLLEQQQRQQGGGAG